MPKWRKYDQKTVLLRPSGAADLAQVDALSQLSRRLQRQRVSKHERITENTLIRVGVDLLLAVADRLEGDDEEALRRSALGLFRDP